MSWLDNEHSLPVLWERIKKLIKLHADNKENPHGVTKAQVGLGSVDNTADKDKKVAEATKATQDGAGNVITDTYLKKVDAPSSSGQEVYSEEITLKSSSWSSNTMIIAPSHVTATNTVIVKPPYEYEDAYSSAGIKAIEQGAKSLKLTCDTPPASDIKVVIITIT